MDPITVLTAVSTISKTVTSLATKLYAFVDDTRNVEQSVQDLTTEVTSLATILIQVESVLKTPNPTLNSSHGNTIDPSQLWKTVYGALLDCQSTVSRIDSALGGVKDNRSNWASEALRAIKFNLKKDEIVYLRQKTHTHCFALNTILALVNIQATQSLHTLGPKIDDLQNSVARLTSSLTDQATSTPQTPAVTKQTDLKRTEQLGALAAQYVTKTKTIYAASIASGSLYGDGSNAETQLRTSNWIADVSGTSERLSSAATVIDFRPDPSVVNRLNATKEGEKHHAPSDNESDSDDDLDFNVAQKLLERGYKHFDAADYANAVKVLQRFLATIANFRMRKRERFNLKEIPAKIAICLYYTHELDLAEEALVDLVHKPTTDDADAVRVCQLSLMLSHVYALHHQVEKAEMYCRSALKGRRLLLGSKHKDYFEAVAWLSALYKARGNDHKAAEYRDMIPPEFSVEFDERKYLQAGWSVVCATNDGGFVLGCHATRPQLLTCRVVSKLRMVTASMDGRLFIGCSSTAWFAVDAHTGRTLVSSPPQGELLGEIVLSPDSQWLASGSSSGEVTIWDINTAVATKKLKVCSGKITAMAFSPKDKSLAIADQNYVFLWDIELGVERNSLLVTNLKVSEISFYPDGDQVLVSGYGRFQNQKFSRRWEEKNMLVADALTILQKPLRTAIGNRDYTISIDDGGKLEGHTESIQSITFSPDGQLLASASANKLVVWDVEQRVHTSLFDGSLGTVNSLAFMRTHHFCLPETKPSTEKASTSSTSTSEYLPATSTSEPLPATSTSTPVSTATEGGLLWLLAVLAISLLYKLFWT